MKWLVFLLVGGLLMSSCHDGVPAKYPDRDRVVMAQKFWCKVLSEVDSEEGTWGYTSECEAVYPSGSSDFLARFARCYKREREQYGEDAPDNYLMVQSCTQQVLAITDPGPVRETELVQARCRRAERCEKVSYADCLSGFEQVAGADRALFTSMYNLRAQHEIAVCLGEAECIKDEDAARQACYQSAQERRVWFTTQLGRDPGLEPGPRKR